MTLIVPEFPPVVDASVAIKWYLPETHSDKARLLVAQNHFVDNRQFQVPDLFFAECASILWKRVRHGDTAHDEAILIMDALSALPFIVHSHQPLMRAALEIAISTDRSVYDSLYIALAVREATRMITADEKLFRALSGGSLEAYLLWIEDIEEIL